MPHLVEPAVRPEGWGVDADPQNRPGVPRERAPDAGYGASAPPPRQTTAEPGHVRADVMDPTPVWGTAQPLKGLSGWIRRNAYMIPDNRPSHWLLLMAGDRVDVIESAASELIRKKPAVVVGVAALALAATLKLRGRS